jgi:hypothetical protein
MKMPTILLKEHWYSCTRYLKCQLYYYHTLLNTMFLMNTIDAKDLDGLLQVSDSSTEDYHYKKGL